MNRLLKRSGFTLIETLVAVAILALAVSGPLFAADRSLIASQVANDQLTASSLAQEGIEYIRWIRDNTYLSAYKAGGTDVSTAAWQVFNTDVTPCNTSYGCSLDPVGTPTPAGQTGSALQKCSASSPCGPLYLNPADIYTQLPTAGNTKTIYTRTVQVSAVPSSSTEDQVISTVSWNYHGTAYKISIVDNLTPWQ